MHTDAFSRAKKNTAAFLPLYPFGDAVSDFPVNVASAFNGTFHHRFGHTSLEMSDVVGDQPLVECVIHNLRHQGSGLTEMVVLLAQGESLAYELAAGSPTF